MNEVKWGGMSRMKAACTALVISAVVPVAAFAQAAGVDTSEIESKIEMYAAAAVALILVFALARWGKRAAKLVG